MPPVGIHAFGIETIQRVNLIVTDLVQHADTTDIATVTKAPCCFATTQEPLFPVYHSLVLSFVLLLMTDITSFLSFTLIAITPFLLISDGKSNGGNSLSNAD